jgi:hypothetical protein
LSADIAGTDKKMEDADIKIAVATKKIAGADKKMEGAGAKIADMAPPSAVFCAVLAIAGAAHAGFRRSDTRFVEAGLEDGRRPIDSRIQRDDDDDVRPFDHLDSPFDKAIQDPFCPVQPCSCAIPASFCRIPTLDGSIQASTRAARRLDGLAPTTFADNAR